MTDDKKKMGRPPEWVISPLCNEASPAKVAAIVVRTKPKKRGNWGEAISHIQRSDESKDEASRRAGKGLAAALFVLLFSLPFFIALFGDG